MGMGKTTDLPPDLVGNLGEIARGSVRRLLGQVARHLVSRHAPVNWNPVDHDPVPPSQETRAPLSPHPMASRPLGALGNEKVDEYAKAAAEGGEPDSTVPDEYRR